MSKTLSTISVVAVTGGSGEPVFVTQPPAQFDFTVGVVGEAAAGKVTDPEGDPLAVGLVSPIAGVSVRYDAASGDITAAWNGNGTPGDYNFQLYADDTISGGPSIAVLSVSPPSVRVAGGPGNVGGDWVGIAAAGSALESFIDWRWLDGTQSSNPPATAITAATLTFNAHPAASYEARFFAKRGYELLASAPFTVDT